MRDKKRELSHLPVYCLDIFMACMACPKLDQTGTGSRNSTYKVEGSKGSEPLPLPPK